ncbi:MAG: Gfo/Idh/MocA family oxidoreductase [Planctomycetota bacterium]
MHTDDTRPAANSRRGTQASRRSFLKATAAATAAAPYIWTPAAAADTTGTPPQAAPSDRPVLGVIGVGNRGGYVGWLGSQHGSIAAVADVDSNHLGGFIRGREKHQDKAPDGYKNYERILERRDIDAVLISTPDHWHAKMAIEAMQAGKDVFCEKPLTLTVEEGQLISKAVRQTGRVFQVGTQQRSDTARFLTAIALIRAGRIGEVKRIYVGIDGGRRGGPFTPSPVPQSLDWDLWQGQTPSVAYVKERCHHTFRWWYDYSAGKLTDWGAHHMDIAFWGAGLEATGPVSVTPVSSTHPVDFAEGYPVETDRFNTATQFQIDYRFASGVRLRLGDRIKTETADFGNGILFEGTKGRFFVNRGKLVGKPVDQLADDPLPEGALDAVYKGRKPKRHMADFFDCIKSREEPISDVHSHHRSLSACHLGAIALRLGRPFAFDPEREVVLDDPQANGMLRREQRAGFELPSV